MDHRIEANPKIMLGKPVIRGTRITVEHILKLIKQGLTLEDITQDYPHLKKADIQAALDYAADALSKERAYPLNFAA